MNELITAFIPSLGGGGAQGVFVTVMNDYIQLGCRINAVVETMSNDVHSKELDKRITITDLQASSSKKSFFKVIKYIKNNKIGIAFAFSPELAVNVLIAQKLLHKKFPIIARCINTLSYEYSNANGWFRRNISSRLVKNIYHNVTYVVAQAERMADDLVENYSFKKEQVIVINNPLSEKYDGQDLIIPLEERNDCILYVGRFEKQKGLEMLLEAFSNIKHKDVKLLMIGRGKQTNDILSFVEQKGLKDRVEVLPFTNNIEQYYMHSKLTVMSSIFEGFPNVLSESIACGTPVVSYDLPSGPSDIVINGENGFLAKYLDVEDLVIKIDRALDYQWDYRQVSKTAKRFQKANILPKYRMLLEKKGIV